MLRYVTSRRDTFSLGWLILHVAWRNVTLQYVTYIYSESSLSTTVCILLYVLRASRYRDGVPGVATVLLLAIIIFRDLVMRPITKSIMWTSKNLFIFFVYVRLIVFLLNVCDWNKKKNNSDSNSLNLKKIAKKYTNLRILCCFHPVRMLLLTFRCVLLLFCTSLRLVFRERHVFPTTTLTVVSLRHLICIRSISLGTTLPLYQPFLCIFSTIISVCRLQVSKIT